MSDVIAQRTTRDAVLASLREAGRPLTVSEVRQRVKNGSGLAVDRSTIYSALNRLANQQITSYDLGTDGRTQLWRAVPEER